MGEPAAEQAWSVAPLSLALGSLVREVGTWGPSATRPKVPSIGASRPLTRGSSLLAEEVRNLRPPDEAHMGRRDVC